MLVRIASVHYRPKSLQTLLAQFAPLLDPTHFWAEYCKFTLNYLIVGKISHEPITWSEEHLEAFRRAQQALKDNKTIHLPRPGDVLWIVTDASVKVGGIGATMYLLRGQKLILAGFVNARLGKHQVIWLSYEVEALCITSAVKQFSPFIIQGKQPAQIKLIANLVSRLIFSASSRVTSFLSTVSRF